MIEKKISFQLISILVTIIVAVISILIGFNIPISNTIIFSMLMFIISIQIIWFYSWYNNKDNMFKQEETKKRDQAYKLIKKTKSNLYTTHFSKSIPPDEYTLKMIEKLENGVDIYRIIDEKIANNQDVKKWLKQFDKYDNYHQYLSDQELPFDISVFDGKKAILYFPSHPQADDFNMSLYIENEHLAHVFMMVFTKIQGSTQKFNAIPKIKSGKVWLKDAFHVPYLVVEGVIISNNENIEEKVLSKYRKVDLNNLGRAYALDDNNRLILCINGTRCALCYYISGEITANLSYMDILISLRETLDDQILLIEEFFLKNGMKINFTKVYLEDPARGIG